MKTKEITFRAALILAFAGTFFVRGVIAQTPGAQWASNWQMQDVGRVDVPGEAKESTPGVLTVSGSGADIWGGADGFHFVYQEIDGDFEFVARLDSMEKTHVWAKAGVMVRASLAESSAHAMVAMAPEKGSTFIRRLENAQWSRDDAHQSARLIARNGRLVYQQRGSAGVEQAKDSLTSAAFPHWVKLVRRADVIQAYESADGITWDWLGTERINIPSKCYLGLAVTSHDSSRLCRAEFSEVNLHRPIAQVSAIPRQGTGDGLRATYYSALDLSGSGVKRVDRVIDFDWGRESPAEGIGRNLFSVRWEGEIEAQFTEPYALQLVSDDRARMWLNGQLVIDEWYEHAEQASTAVVSFEAGRRYLLRVEYFENRGRALAKLFWSSPSTPRRIIPQTQLYSTPTDEDRDGLPDLWELSHGMRADDPKDADQPSGGSTLANRQLYNKGLDAAPIARQMGSWFSQDVGAVGIDGTAAASDGVWNLGGSGPDIWANADGFQFLYQEWNGDGEIVARLKAQENTDPWAKAGLMIRESLDPGARHVMLAATPGNGLAVLTRRNVQGTTTQQPAPSTSVGPWLKLVRRTDAVAVFASSDGLNWEWIATEKAPFGQGAYLGLAVCSHDNARAGTAAFDNVSIQAPASGATQAPERIRGSGVGLLGTYFDASTGTVASRLDPGVDFDWDMDSPVEGIGADHFSVRWEGFLEPQSTGIHTLQVVTDDGARLWLNDQLLIDGWSDRGVTADIVRVSLEAARHYNIRLEYFERTAEAIARLLWSSPTLPLQAIPPEQLYPAVELTSEADASASGTATIQAVELTGKATAESQQASTTTKSPLTGAESAIPGITGIQTVSTLPGATAVIMIGEWAIDGDVIYSISRRGGLEYEIEIPSADLYRIEVEASSRNPFDPDQGYYLSLAVDDETVSEALLSANFVQAGKAHALTPWLQPGAHRFRIFWDNARKGRSIQINAIRLQVLDGPDQNRDGVKDWIEEKLGRENGVDGLEGDGAVAADAGVSSSPLRIRHEVAALPIIHSAISPACIEGRGEFLSMMEARALGDTVTPQHGINGRWYINMPLAAESPSDVAVAYQNQGRTQRFLVDWLPTNLLIAEDMTVREGDSLLLTVAPQATGLRRPARTGGGVGLMRIDIDGSPKYAGPASPGFPYRFEKPGLVAVSVTYTSPDGSTLDRAIEVTVVGGSLGGGPVAWIDHDRTWSCPILPAGVVLEHDNDLTLTENSPSEPRQYLLRTKSSQDKWIIARVGKHGPILGSVPVRGLAITGVSESGAFYGQVFDDGSRLVETAVTQSRLFPDVRVVLNIIVGGVMFEDGSLQRTLRVADFDPTGLATVRFIMPPGVKTSNCHIMRGYENQVVLGDY